tara:strand:- start:670 stop:993 length:324 start_codon:yes stop_codon:yes gene_type:complete
VYALGGMMKTNIAVELNDAERNHLAKIFQGKATKAMITRKELNDLISLMVNDLLGSESNIQVKAVTDRVIKEGFKYRFNDVEVSPEVFNEGIKAWLEVDCTSTRYVL